MSDKSFDIFDDNARRKLISTMDFKTLNDYLKNMDRIAKRKGGKYLEMYNKDLGYVMSLNDTDYQDGGDLLNLFPKQNDDDIDDDDDDDLKVNIKENENDITMTEQVLDTEAYVQRITNIINKTPQKETELAMIKTKLTKNNDKNCVYRFIDIVKTVDNSLTQNEYNAIKELTKLIIHDNILLKTAFEYMGKTLNQANVSQEFVKKLAELRLIKHKMTKQQYNNEKDLLIKYYIKKNGFNNVCQSKLVEKIIYICRKNKSTT